jgi:glycerol-3-phosphate dehydrogenase
MVPWSVDVAAESGMDDERLERMSSGQLGPEQRTSSIASLQSSTFDVLVVGGGITGCGVALDAVTRGYSVALVEARDLASGSSSRSSKLIHGGLRYLEMLDFGLVREALLERGLLTRQLAPHLVHPLPFVMPLRKPVVERAYMGAGLFLYDLLARLGSAPRLPLHRHLSKRKTQQIWPALKDEHLRGGLQYFDAQVDDARYTMMVARTAAAHGAHIVNRCRVSGLLRTGDRVTGVVAIDDDNPRSPFEVKARVVINAAGVWMPEIAEFLPERPKQANVRASKGIHLVVPKDRIAASGGLISRTEKSVLFVIPWGEHWIIGTTDTDWGHDRVHPAASARDIDYVLDHVNALLKTPLTKADVQGVYVGLRPLVASNETSTTKLSREHAVSQLAPGLVGISGGKYTTYRVMAEDVVDAATPFVVGARDASADEYSVRPSRTHETPIIGAPRNDWPATDHHVAQMSNRHGVSAEQVRRLLGRYGTLVDEVLSAGSHELLPGTDDYLEAEVVYATTHEGARHVEDVLTRRTRMSIETWSRGVDAAPRVAALMGAILGWDAKRREAEITHYEKRVAAERASHDAVDDAAADALRRVAGDIVDAVRAAT